MRIEGRHWYEAERHKHSCTFPWRARTSGGCSRLAFALDYAPGGQISGTSLDRYLEAFLQEVARIARAPGPATAKSVRKGELHRGP